jgi:hypothetical protein
MQDENNEDIYIYETLAELDEYEQAAADTKIVDAQARAHVTAIFVVILIMLILVVLRHSAVYQVLVCIGVIVIWGVYYLLRLLDLCDD